MSDYNIAKRVRAILVSTITMLGIAGSNVEARTLYVSSSTGNDANDGLSPEAAGSSGPFRSLDRLANIQMGEGDQLLFRCGDLFLGQLDINVASAGNQPLRIASYGNCSAGSRPTLDGSRAVENNSIGGDGLISAPSRRNVAQVFADGSSLPQARFPESTYLMVPAGTPGRKEGFPASLAGGKDVLGAEAWARTQAWFIEERVITKVVDGTARFDKPLDWPLDGGSGLYFTGKAWMLTEAPGWARDASTEVLSVRTRSGTKEIRASYREPLVRISGPGSVVVEGLALTRAGEDALSILAKGDVTVSNVVVQDAGRNGIAITGARSTNVSRNTIERVGRDGILVERLSNLVVRGNVLKDISMLDRPRPALAAINATSSTGAAIEDNRITGAGYIGIRFYDGATVRGNTIEGACLTMGDCGAIYTWRGNAKSDMAAPSIVADNTIVDVPGERSVKPGWRTYAAGIYLDDLATNVEVTNNVIVGARQGIYLHNAYENSLQGNAVLGSGDVSLALAMDSEKFAATRRLDNVVENNGFYVPAGESSVLMIRRTPNEPFARFAGNTIVGKNAKQRRTAVYRNKGTFSVPDYALSEGSTKGLTGEENEEVLDSPQASGAASSKWRIETVGDTRRLSNGVWTVNQRVAASSMGERTISPGNCKQFRPRPRKGKPADQDGGEKVIEICSQTTN